VEGLLDLIEGVGAVRNARGAGTSDVVAACVKAVGEEEEDRGSRGSAGELARALGSEVGRPKVRSVSLLSSGTVGSGLVVGEVSLCLI
jgi:hypothetical protein